MSSATRSQKLLRTTRTLLLTLGLLASTLVGCGGPLVREDDALTGYRRELAKLVETGVLTKEDEEKFYQIASLEMERRANQAPPTLGSDYASDRPLARKATEL